MEGHKYALQDRDMLRQRSPESLEPFFFFFYIFVVKHVLVNSWARCWGTESHLFFLSTTYRTSLPPLVFALFRAGTRCNIVESNTADCGMYRSLAVSKQRSISACCKCASELQRFAEAFLGIVFVGSYPITKC